MKNKILKIALAICVLPSCSTQSLKVNMNNLFENKQPPTRSIAATDINLQITAQVKTHQVCERSFDSVSFISSDARFAVETKTVKKAGKKFGYVWPKKIVRTTQQDLTRISKSTTPKSVKLNNPPMPVLPIIPLDAPAKVKADFCKSVQDYHKSFEGSSALQRDKGDGIPTDPIDIGPLDPIDPVDPVDPTPVETPKPDFTQKAFLIFYTDQYANEVSTISAIYRNLGFIVQAMAVSQIPGINTSKIPAECAGDYFVECYHDTSKRTSSTITRMGVGSLKGFYTVPTSTRESTTSTLVPYIPGLIRAEIRKQKKLKPLAGVLLVGNSEKLASFYYPMLHYGEDNSDPVNRPPAMMNTDLFYIVPSPPLELAPEIHHNRPTVFKWTCRNTVTGEIKMKTYCEQIDERYWSPVTPLADHRWEPRIPSSRVFRFKNVWSISGNPIFANYTEDDVVPVGRIVTHHDQSTKDPIVARYAQKIARWHNELPPFQGSSIASYGGRDEDTWTFIDSDVSQFATTFGATSKQYASQYFVPLATCQGKCTFKGAADIFAELASSNHTSFYMTGHGGHMLNQSPYPTGYNLNDPALNFSSESYYKLLGHDIQVKLGKQAYPISSTVKPLINRGLIGHVVANSCDLSNINLDRGWDNSIRQIKADANQRSLAEQFIQVENGGAMNTFLNSDVGYGYIDDRYNQKFMINSEKANTRCGTIGDALRLTVLDMLKGDTYNAGDWQLLNRQFLGSPINRIARLPSKCMGIILDENPVDVDPK